MIKLENISKNYGDHIIFDNMSITFDEENSLNGIIGKSGSGKTTLFNIMFGLDTSYDGKYSIDNRNTRDFSNKIWDKTRREDIHIVFQDFKLIENFTVLENLTLTLNCSVSSAEDALEKLNILELKNEKVRNISGGEKQRLAISRAIIGNPKILLLDEPTGNLDDTHADIIMKCVQSLKNENMMIFIITHDNRIIDYCDNIYLLEDKHLKLYRKQNKLSQSISKNQENKNIEENNKKHNLKYVLKSIQRNLVDIVVNYVPVSIIFMLFMTIFLFFYSISINDLYEFYSGIDDKTIYVSTTHYTKNYINKCSKNNYVAFDDGKRISFSANDLLNVKKISGVKSATLFNGDVKTSADKSGNNLNLNLSKESLSKTVRKTKSYSHYPDKIEFEFQTLTVPVEYINNYNPEHIELLYGNYPVNNQVLLPDFLAYNYCDNDLEDLVNKNIELPIVDQKRNQISKNYKVAGIYRTNFENNVNLKEYIYVSYQNYDFLDVFSTEEQFNDYRVQFNQENSNYNIDQSVFKDYETYLDALGTGLNDMIITCKTSKDVINVTKKLNDLFPNLRLMSQYEFKNGEFRDTYIQTVLINIGMIIFIATILGIIILFLNKGYIRKRNKELAVLYSLGHSRREVIMIILLEYILISTIAFIIGYSMLFIARTVYLKYLTNFNFLSLMFDGKAIFNIYLYIILMTFISVIFSIHGINRKKLNEYLK
ncbi:ATP-binding cassette domain-containing protein [Faecalibacillus faecis]|uniref:ATP-binding cassette domain-containing protein n=1 Tax=Faecalibacillus faecis TaxID=1982628 RepID=UPI001D071998|nr:ATP-binding cassette domain-containing protein [Faecalibacillus faecis]MCB7489261.1 ATP-binding cassette domain-containing protein [Faecalibacillus faecis]MCC3209767.1 ATP-binding cassette domain-containing protein [bacterium TM462]MCG4592975.1 ATP-binding cassette domain-containing protein [Faecalibacillus faecis]